MSVRRFVERLRSALWFLPGVFLALAILQALVIPEWEERHGGTAVGEFFFEGGPDGARVLLSMVSGSTLTLMVLVFSITIVALQLASSQFSPRVLRSFLRDWYSQLSLGVFTATFAYSITVLRAVRSDEAGSTAFVPRLAVALAFFWALASVVVFVLYVHHTASSIRVVSVIGRIGTESRAMIERDYLAPVHGAGTAAAAPPDGAPDEVLMAPVSGVLTDVEVGRLDRLATEVGVRVRLAVPVGDFVPVGAPCCWCTAAPQAIVLRPWSARSASARSAPTGRTSGTGSANSSTSPSERCRRRSTTPPPRCRRWTASTTCSACWARPRGRRAPTAG